MPPSKTPNARELFDWPVEWLRIAGPPETERLSGVDWDTFKRNHPDKVVHVSARRVGARVGHALMIGGHAPRGEGYPLGAPSPWRRSGPSQPTRRHKQLRPASGKETPAAATQKGLDKCPVAKAAHGGNPCRVASANSARWGQSYREAEQRRLAELSRQLALQLNRATPKAQEEVAET